jgi:DNA-binding beta-propeller fold protein YncE
VAIGQWFERRQDGEINVIAWPGWTLAPAGDRIYVVDPESTRISVVDLDRLEVEQVARLTPPESPLERLGGWLRDRVVTRAEAKGGLYHTRQVEVSADGTRLYITGTDGDTCASNPGLDCARVPLGLLVVDTATMQLVHEEPLVDAFVLTPDGSRILATGTYSDWSDHDSDDETVLGYTGTGLKILDAETYEVLAHVRPDGLLWSHPAITRDGRFAHATIEGAGLDAAQEENAACTEACTLLLVINLERGEIVAERSFDAYYVQPIGVAYTSAGSE